MKKQLQYTGYMGLVGAILMFTGDMLLYYTPKSFDYKTAFLTILGQSSHNRLFWGGFLGPVASFLYCIGFYQLYLAIQPNFWKIFVFVVLSLSIIIGGSFHSHFTYMGFASAEKQEGLLNLIRNNIMLYYFITMGLSLLGFLTLSILIFLKKTFYPRWMLLFTPLIWIFGFKPMQSLPSPFAVIIAGGWMNLIHILFFVISTYILTRNEQ